MTMHRAAVFAFLILLLPLNSMSAGTEGWDSDDATTEIFSKVQGCYELSPIKWVPDPKEDIKYLTVSKRIWLTRSKAYSKDTYVLRPAPGQPQSIHDLMYWVIGSKGEIQLHWHTGVVQLGLLMTFQPPSARGQRMEGFAQVAFDVPTPYKKAPVTATRVPCGDDD